MAGALWSPRSWRDSELAECSQPREQPSIFPVASNQAPRSSASMQRTKALQQIVPESRTRMESTFLARTSVPSTPEGQVCAAWLCALQSWVHWQRSLRL